MIADDPWIVCNFYCTVMCDVIQLLRMRHYVTAILQ